MKKIDRPIYKTQDNGRRDALRYSRDAPLLAYLELRFPTCGSRSAGIIRLETKGQREELMNTTVICLFITKHQVK
jgi:hypothetical protein